jgi:hypothetical protein
MGYFNLMRGKANRGRLSTVVQRCLGFLFSFFFEDMGFMYIFAVNTYFILSLSH